MSIKPINRSIFIGDNLSILKNFDDNFFDLIYADPPFNSNRNYKANSGSFRDVWNSKTLDEEWTKKIQLENKKLWKLLDVFYNTLDDKIKDSNNVYLQFIAVRLIEMHRILKPTGSLYLHCDTTMSHFLKVILDCIFGVNNFRNEIVWYYNSGARNKKDFGKRYDVIFRYSKTDDYFVDFDNKYAREPYSPDINVPKSKEHYYDSRGKVIDDVWRIKIISQNDKRERVGYPTQKPIELLKRIIATSTSNDGFVLDPFCGSGTTMAASDMLGRNWIGIDINEEVINVIKKRFLGLDINFIKV